jgi:L,D-transpeptidase catalytic domain/Putative peptidoglycan binding domain/PKD domain
MVRRIPLLVALAALALPGHALAAPPSVTAQATPANGAAPLAVTLTATGDATAYHWDLGDGASADGAAVEHTYAAGAWTATVTATGADGETAQASVQVTATGVTLRAPKVVAYGKPALFRGRVVPATAGTRVAIVAGSRTVTHAKTKSDGSFRVRTRVRFPGQYEARAAGAASTDVPLFVRPLVSASLAGAGVVGQPLTLHARLTPAAAGSVRVRIWRNGRETLDRTTRAATIRLGTGAAASFRIRVEAVPARGYARAARQLLTAVHSPVLSLGSRGPSVLSLEQRLHELHYALSAVDGYFGYDTLEAVYAFQKVNGLPRTGVADGLVWRRLQTATVPKARYGGDRIEVDKTRQVLFVVRHGEVSLVVAVSTGATGNTPLGRFHVYSKVPGYNAKLMYFSSFFIGGFAIHGYSSVPPYPASHGCVRVPIWVAVRLYEVASYGTEVDVYL